MIPKEKAFELYKMYNNILIEEIIDKKPTYLVMTHKMAKKSALIAVNYIITSNPYSNPFNTDVYSTISYWEDVKNEIELL